MDTTELRIDTAGRHVLDLTDQGGRLRRPGRRGRAAVCVRPPRHRRAGRDGDRVGVRGGPGGGPGRLLPRDDRWTHRHGSRGHGADHLLPVFAGPSLTVPVQAGRLLLGTWQRICLVDLNDDNPGAGSA
jgi:hypothetical protein